MVRTSDKLFAIPQPQTIAYTLMFLSDVLTGDGKISLQHLYLVYNLVSTNRYYKHAYLISYQKIPSIPTMFGKLSLKYVTQISENKKRSQKQDLFRAFLLWTYGKSSQFIEMKEIHAAYQNSRPTQMKQLTVVQPTDQMKDVIINIDVEQIFKGSQQKIKMYIYLTLWHFSGKLRQQVLQSQQKQSEVTLPTPIPRIQKPPSQKESFGPFGPQFTQYMKQKRSQQKKQIQHNQSQLKKILQKKQIQFGDFSKYAYLKEKQDLNKNYEVDMIVRQALQSHKKAIQIYSALDWKVKQKLTKSWQMFISQFPFIKTEKQFQEFTQNPVIFFIKNRIHKIDIKQISQQFSRIMIRYFNYIKIQGYVLHKQHLLMGRAVQYAETKYIPVEEEGKALLSLKDKSINYLVNGRLVKKAAGYYLTNAEIGFLQAKIVEFLKVKNIDGSKLNIKKILAQQLQKFHQKGT